MCTGCQRCTKNRIKVRFIIATRKSSLNPKFIVYFLDKYKHIKINVAFLQMLTIFAYKIINRTNSILTFDFSTLCTKLPHNKRLMVLSNLTDFCLDGGEKRYITANSYGARWVKNINDNQVCLNKQQIKDAFAILPFNHYFTVGLRSSDRLSVFLWV